MNSHKLIRRLQNERDEYKSEAAKARDELREKEIRYREALAGANAATAAVQITLTQTTIDKEAALQQIEVCLQCPHR